MELMRAVRRYLVGWDRDQDCRQQIPGPGPLAGH